LSTTSAAVGAQFRSALLPGGIDQTFFPFTQHVPSLGPTPAAST
jgi:hypothetical protein